MKHCMRYTGSALVAAAALTAALAMAGDGPECQAPDPKMAEMMKNAEAAGTPGEAHKALEPLVGLWSAEVKCWMAQETSPKVTKATAKASWVMNGRFVQEEFSGEMMGKPFRGMSLIGYDNTRKKYNSLWVDDMHTSMFTIEGTPESDGQVLVFNGKMDCPMTGQKDMPVKQILRIVSRDRHIFEMHDPTKSEHSKTLEITYTREGSLLSQHDTKAAQ